MTVMTNNLNATNMTQHMKKQSVGMNVLGTDGNDETFDID